MDWKEDTTVTKCPACGRVTVGFTPACPGCAHQFTGPDQNLPVVREQTEEFQTRHITDRLETRTTRRPPKHIVVPVLAGLLVALVVLILLRFSAPERSPHAPFPHGQAVGRTDAAPTSSADIVRAESPHPTQPTRRDGSVPSLGPGARKVVPSDVSLFPAEEQDHLLQDQLDVLVDGSFETCFFHDPKLDGRKIVIRFPSPLRFSHVLFHVSCLRTARKDRHGRARLQTEDGSERDILIPGVAGPTWVDLAGAWTSSITIDMGDEPLHDIGLGELEFFAFDD